MRLLFKIVGERHMGNIVEEPTCRNQHLFGGGDIEVGCQPLILAKTGEFFQQILGIVD